MHVEYPRGPLQCLCLKDRLSPPSPPGQIPNHLGRDLMRSAWDQHGVSCRRIRLPTCPGARDASHRDLACLNTDYRPRRRLSQRAETVFLLPGVTFNHFAEASMIGKTLGSYRIIEQVGMGGMATVFKAFDTNTDRYVALKILPEHLSTNAGFRTRFHREAKAIAKLEHLHILPVFTYGEEGNIAYLVMRYMQAGTLSELIAKGPLPLHEIDRLLSQMASAIDYAHDQGILHRDVKPKNILLDEYGNTYLTDFGIAKIVETTTDLTGNSILGTPMYMSPEQCLGDKNLTPATDIYSLGIVLFEMLTGRPPFDAETPIAVIHMQLNAPLPLPRSLRPDLPEGVERVVLKALAKTPENRYDRAEEMASAFHQAISRADTERVERIPSPSDGSTTPTWVEVPRTLSATPSRVALRDEPAAHEKPLAEIPSLGSSRRRIPSWLWALGGAAGFLCVAAAVFATLGVFRGRLPSRQAVAANGTSATQTLAVPDTPSEATQTGGGGGPASASTQTSTPSDPRLQGAMTDPWGHVAVRPGDQIRLGLALALSGGDSNSRSIAADQERAARLAINEFGPVAGFPVTFSLEDSGCSAEGGTHAANSLVSMTDVVGIVGPTCSTELMAGMTIFDQARIVFISPSSTRDGVNAVGLPTFNRVAYQDSVNPFGSGRSADENTSAYQAFAKRFSGAFSRPCCQPFAAEAYDATVILLSSIAEVAVLDSAGDIIIPRELLAEKVRATHGFLGVTGTITFDDHGDRIPPN